MPRILAIDYGLKRTGLAATDPEQIIASALETVATSELLQFLKNYLAQEQVEAIVVGYPTNLQGKATDATTLVEKFTENLKTLYPEIPLHLHDERFTSKMALDAMIAGGTSKKYRRNKANIDRVSAVIILQSFLESKH